jgi:hypothetical protein
MERLIELGGMSGQACSPAMYRFLSARARTAPCAPIMISARADAEEIRSSSPPDIMQEFPVGSTPIPT